MVVVTVAVIAVFAVVICGCGDSSDFVGGGGVNRGAGSDCGCELIVAVAMEALISSFIISMVKVYVYSKTRISRQFLFYASGMLLQSYELGGKMVDVYQYDQKFIGRTIRQTLSVFRDTFTPVSSVVEEVYSGSEY